MVMQLFGRCQWRAASTRVPSSPTYKMCVHSKRLVPGTPECAGASQDQKIGESHHQAEG